ncbi:MAG: hypothetical protein HY288_08490 [Planctomycetia bacterium]|nr:hypothetical protein [Planctomycetia bacterium]
MDFALIDQTSERFLGQWKRLVSTTNWEKGQIIHAWRDALRDSGTPSGEYSDESWSRRVGNVTPQHVGRLRRVYERFGAVRDEHPGLFWSHFQAALDWDDAEMYLEGAVQSCWSISEMRHQRWEARGGLEGEPPADDEASLAPPWDEDADRDEASGEVVSGTLGAVRSPELSPSDEKENEYDRSEFDDADGNGESEYDSKAASAGAEIVRPFASLPPLPADVNDAFEAYKLCILRHKLAGWQDISRADLVASLDALKQLALAPAGN